MKKIAVILLALCLVFSSSACGGKPAAAPESAETDPGAPLSLSPLLQTASEGGATRLIPTRRGVIALWERGEGYSAAFVSGADSAMTEDLLEGEGDLSVSGFLETETGKGLFVTRNTAAYLLLAGEEDLPRSLGEGVNFSGVFYRDEGLICWKDDLLLLVPADLGAPLVLADTASFADFGTVVTVSPDGSRVWYVEENDKIGIYGLAAFRPGESKREREIRLTFDGVLAASGESVLLWRRIGGETVFTLLSLATEQAVSLTVDAAPGLVSLSPGNGRLALWDAGKGALRIWNVQTGGELEVQETSELGEAVALCYSGDGALYVSFRRDNGEILATLE